MKRRHFLKLAAATAVGSVVPVSGLLQNRYDIFLENLRKHVIHVVGRDEVIIDRLWIEPIQETNGEHFRFVRLWCRNQDGTLLKPYTWNQRY